MPKIFTIYATEEVYYEIKVMADNEDDAREQVMMGNYSSWENIDGDHFHIEEIMEEANA